jgi:hypothetical protein
MMSETTFNKKFLRGGPGGAVFSKSAPPGRRRHFTNISFFYKITPWKH